MQYMFLINKWDKLIWSHKLGYTIQCISEFTAIEAQVREPAPWRGTTKKFTDSGLKHQPPSQPLM